MSQPTETVMRPEPGLARGRWEAPAWGLWVALAVLLASSVVYASRNAFRGVGRRSGRLNEPKRGAAKVHKGKG